MESYTGYDRMEAGNLLHFAPHPQRFQRQG